MQPCSGGSNLPGSSLVDGTVVMEVGGEKDGGGSTGPQTISASLSLPREGQDEASSAAHTTVGGEDRSGPKKNKCQEEINGKDDHQRGGPSEPPASTEDRDLCSEGDTRTEAGQSTPIAAFLQQQGTSPSPQDASLFGTNEVLIIVVFSFQYLWIVRIQYHKNVLCIHSIVCMYCVYTVLYVCIVCIQYCVYVLCIQYCMSVLCVWIDSFLRVLGDDPRINSPSLWEFV